MDEVIQGQLWYPGQENGHRPLSIEERHELEDQATLESQIEIWEKTAGWMHERMKPYWWPPGRTEWRKPDELPPYLPPVPEPVLMIKPYYQHGSKSRQMRILPGYDIWVKSGYVKHTGTSGDSDDQRDRRPRADLDSTVSGLYCVSNFAPWSPPPNRTLLYIGSAENLFLRIYYGSAWRTDANGVWVLDHHCLIPGDKISWIPFTTKDNWFLHMEDTYIAALDPIRNHNTEHWEKRRKGNEDSSDRGTGVFGFAPS